MNSYSLSLSSSTISSVEIRNEILLDDHTNLIVSLSGLSESIIPVYVRFDWGDGDQETITNLVYKNYREDSIIPEILYGKFSYIISNTFSHTYYPSPSARYKSLSAQIYVEYVDGHYCWFVQPIKIVTRDYFEAIYDIKLINTNILPISSNIKQHQFSVDAGGFLIETTQ